MAMLNHVALSGDVITVSLTALKLGLSTLEVGTLVAIFAVLPMLASIHAGRWVDKIGTWTPMPVGSVLTCLGTALPFVAQTQSALLVARLLHRHRLHAASGFRTRPAGPRRGRPPAAQLS